MPSTFVIDKTGGVRVLNAGFDGKVDAERLRKKVAGLLSCAMHPASGIRRSVGFLAVAVAVAVTVAWPPGEARAESGFVEILFSIVGWLCLQFMVPVYAVVLILSVAVVRVAYCLRRGGLHTLPLQRLLGAMSLAFSVMMLPPSTFYVLKLRTGRETGALALLFGVIALHGLCGMLLLRWARREGLGNL